MGVAGSGKSTAGARLAVRLGVPFLEGDDAHSAEAKAQMAKGIPLTEAQRGPWLDRLHAELAADTSTGVVLACSALTAASRRQLAGELAAVSFVALVAPEDALAVRLAAPRTTSRAPTCSRLSSRRSSSTRTWRPSTRCNRSTRSSTRPLPPCTGGSRHAEVVHVSLSVPKSRYLGGMFWLWRNRLFGSHSVLERLEARRTSRDRRRPRRGRMPSSPMKLR